MMTEWHAVMKTLIHLAHKLPVLLKENIFLGHLAPQRQSVYPLVRIGIPTPSPASKYAPPPQKKPKGGGGYTLT